MNHHVYHYPRRASEEVFSVMPSSETKVNPPLAAKQHALQELPTHPVAKPGIEEREERAPTPRPRNTRIHAMRQKFENASTCREEAPKKSVSCGSNLAERKRQLGFLTKDQGSQGVARQIRDMNNCSSKSSSSSLKSSSSSLKSSLSSTKSNSSSPKSNSISPKSGSSSSNGSSSSFTASNDCKNRIHKSRFADKKKMFERAFERNECCAETTTTVVPLGERFRPEAAVTHTGSDSEVSPLRYDDTVFSDDTMTTRDDVEMTRLRQAEDHREMVGSHKKEEQTANPIASSLSPNNSYQETLQDIVTDFEKDVKASETVPKPTTRSITTTKATTDISMPNAHCDFMTETARFEGPSPDSMIASFNTERSGPQLSKDGSVNNDALKVIEGVTRCSSMRSTAIPLLKSKSPLDLLPTHLLPGASLFSTVDQEAERNMINNSEQATAKTVEPRKDGENDTTAVTATSVTKCEPVVAESKRPTPEESFTASCRTTRYEIAEQKSQPMMSILEQRHREALSPVSTASWYSSENSSASTEVSQQLSPLQDPKLSIGACVNAHLAENPEAHNRIENHRNAPAVPSRHESSVSALSSVVPMKRASSPCSMSMKTQYSASVQHDTQDLQELAEAMSSMANTASNVVLDVIVEAADKVVVSPLISIFHCVDASEHLLCQGVATANNLNGKSRRSSRGKVQSLRSRSRSRSRPRKCKFRA